MAPSQTLDNLRATAEKKGVVNLDPEERGEKVLEENDASLLYVKTLQPLAKIQSPCENIGKCSNFGVTVTQFGSFNVKHQHS